jgi:hypothetical protein
MGERTSYPQGTFSWVENSTTDPGGAKSFYGALLGWEYDDNPIGDGVVYSMAKLGDKFVGAVAPQMQDEREMGVPPHWNNYVTVDDVDAVAGRIAELGGQVLAPPFDVMEVGRMAVLMDPTGAVLCLWQAKAHIGAGLVNAPGALCWNELATRDPETAKTFYTELLGWSYQQMEGGMPYWIVFVGERSNGGIRPIGDDMPAEVPAHWLPYFAVDDLEKSTASAAERGGEVLAPPMQAGEFKFSALRDPAGAVFALYEGRLDD